MSVPMEMDSEDSFYRDDLNDEDEEQEQELMNLHQDDFQYEDTIRDEQHDKHYKVGINNKNDYKDPTTINNNSNSDFLLGDTTGANRTMDDGFNADILWITGVAMFVFVIFACCGISMVIMINTRKKQTCVAPVIRVRVTSAVSGRRRRESNNNNNNNIDIEGRDNDVSVITASTIEEEYHI